MTAPGLPLPRPRRPPAPARRRRPSATTGGVMTARLVRTEIEVPGTPEEVWEAIATGPGIACWFVPAEVDERVGGEIVTHHGPYGDSRGVVTAWEPPRRFAYEEREWAEGAPPWATEILVEARSGGTCLVRLVSGVFSGGDDWGDEIDGTEAGWALGHGEPAALPDALRRPALLARARGRRRRRGRVARLRRGARRARRGGGRARRRPAGERRRRARAGRDGAAARRRRDRRGLRASRRRHDAPGRARVPLRRRGRRSPRARSRPGAPGWTSTARWNDA